MAAPRSAIPAWVAGYIGLPFAERGRDRAGVDCWGCVRLVLAEQFGVDVPSYVAAGYSIADRKALAALIAGEVEPAWALLPPGEVRPGDVLLMRVEGLPVHVGLVVAPGWMLHVMRGIEACVEAYDGPVWHRRVIGVYRLSGAEE